MRARLARLEVNEKQFRIGAYLTLALMIAVVLTGAAVRLSDSGLGCATWPDCVGGHLTPPSGIHAAIEFGNRVFSSAVGVVSGVIAIMSLLRRPRRKDLIWLAWSQPVGVIAQAVLGGLTVREQLNPWFVMAHFMLSMVILIFTVWLVWNASHEPGTRARAPEHPRGDRVLIYSVRTLAALCALTLIGGTMSTGAGPHSGAHAGQHVGRLHFYGAHTLVWAIEQHATVAVVFGVATVLIWLLKRAMRKAQIAASIV
ncbi:MAG: COX15/CtaA family protein [Solirubrobacteraceae bacterium]